MSKIKRLRKNFVIVISFNVFMILVGVGLSLLLPKYLPKEEYGIYRLLTFYITYSSFIHLGFLDGVYLFFGGKNIYEMDKKENSSIFSSFLLFQFIIGLVFLLAVNIVLSHSINKEVYLLIVADMVLMNIIYFYHYISQLNEKFTLYSIMFLLTRLFVLISLIPLTKAGFTSGITFIIVNLIVNLFIIAYYYINYRKEIKFSIPLIKVQTIKRILTIGFPIFLSGVVAFLIMGIDRFLVDLFFTNIEFAEYSFAVSLIGMFIIFITAITRLLFPYIKLLEADNILEIKYILGIALIIIFGLALSGFYPLSYVVRIFLEEYEASLSLVFILLPLLLFKAEIDISISNVYKAKMLRKKYFQVSLISLIASVIVFAIALTIDKSLESIAIASTISYGLWYIISDLYLHIRLSKGGYSKYILLLAIIASYFLVDSLTLSAVMSFIVYLLIVIILSAIFIYKDFAKIKETIHIVREDLSK